MRTTLRRVALTLATAVGVLVVGGSLPASWTLANNLIASAARSGGQPVPIQAANLTGSGPGSLVSAMTMPGLVASGDGRHLQAARVLYRSTSGDTGAPTVVSGAVMVPVGPPPPGGWPIVAFGHGTTGIDEPCAPSNSDSLMGMSGVVAAIIGKGFAVVMPDYEGLGAPGVHPYTDSRTAGLNMIDAVRALRLTFKNVSSRWVALGHSQGGGAAWAADERARSYAPELDLVGAVALAPAADVSKFVDKAKAGTLTQDQMLAFPLIIESLARRFPELSRDDYRNGWATRSWDALTACSGPLVNQRPAAAAGLAPAQLVPSSPTAENRMRDQLQKWALPQESLSAPMFVVYGSNDKLIDAQWTTDAIARACALGGTITWQLQPGKGHGDIDFSAALSWIVERFAGQPAANDCPSR
ncbi:alpha/beta fold hydrolase [Mycolicibacterium sp. P9-64]|uniref:alpha/beta fold hydrolase n=1 Tax=Mycolicibacterium sp. P9-64 TaxID=2024612 RepID=UPI0011EE419A|nr:alpha/beta fold hydrolase [Mycolicibacterium sp. P9-64]KAA0080246.1 alpha/beta fold hydrolase [Mycolicibacterium sp. P9-64]